TMNLFRTSQRASTRPPPTAPTLRIVTLHGPYSTRVSPRHVCTVTSPPKRSSTATGSSATSSGNGPDSQRSSDAGPSHCQLEAAFDHSTVRVASAVHSLQKAKEELAAAPTKSEGEASDHGAPAAKNSPR